MLDNAVAWAIDSTNVIVILWFFELPLKPAFGSGRKLLDNATAWAIDSTNVIDMFLSEFAVLPLQTCRRFKEKIVGQCHRMGD